MACGDRIGHGEYCSPGHECSRCLRDAGNSSAAGTTAIEELMTLKALIMCGAYTLENVREYIRFTDSSRT